MYVLLLPVSSICQTAWCLDTQYFCIVGDIQLDKAYILRYYIFTATLFMGGRQNVTFYINCLSCSSTSSNMPAYSHCIFISGLSNKTLCAFIFIPLLPVCKQNCHPPRLDYPSDTYRGIPVVALVIMKFSQSFHTFKPICTFQHQIILQHPQPMFLP